MLWGSRSQCDVQQEPGVGFNTQPGRGTDSAPTVLGGEGSREVGAAEHSLWVLSTPRHFAHLKKSEFMPSSAGALDEMGSESEFSSLLKYASSRGECFEIG